ncbi:MAG: TrbI/VirB10 family protein, partial [Acidithiobacillus sp.]
MKSGKELFSGLFGKRGADSPSDSASGPSSAPQPIALKGSGDAKATRIKKAPLYIGLAAVGLAGYAAVEYMQSHNPFAGSSHPVKEQTIKPARSSNGPAVPETKAPYTKPVAPNSSAVSPATSSTTPASPESSAGQTAPQPAKNPYAAQDAAFEASIGDGSSGGATLGLSWKQPQASTPSTSGTPTTTLPAALASEPKARAKKASQPPLVTRETSPYELLQGAVIPAVLEDGIKSYLPGEIRAVVSQNVYSSVNGATLLIPAGSKLVGTYDTKT